MVRRRSANSRSRAVIALTGIAVCATGVGVASAGAVNAAGPACRQSAAPGPPPGEPFIKRGQTGLVSGLFLDGGPLERRGSCRPGTPGAGTIEVLDPAGTRLVARRRVKTGDLAHIRLAPGRYLVRGTFANAMRNGKAIQTLPVRVHILVHRTVRRDVFAAIP
jgi:hypothetical protein